MGCPSEVNVGDSLVFSVTTHTASTGALTDADAVPMYRVYEDETGTAILTGSMAKLDDANTTGFYTEALACTTANGFEDSKTYTIYITAAVGAVTGSISYGFKAITAPATTTMAALWAETPTAEGTDTFQTIVKALYAYVRGRIAKDGFDFSYYDNDGDVSGGTKLFENKVSGDARTPQ